MLAMAILLGHLVGDYIFQSHHVATEKLHSWWWASVHGVLYGWAYVFVFWALGFSISSWALFVIVTTHIVIDRYRLAKYVTWLKNQSFKHKFKLTDTGYPESVPPFLSVWLLIITDNTLHLLINTAAIKWL